MMGGWDREGEGEEERNCEEKGRGGGDEGRRGFGRRR